MGNPLLKGMKMSDQVDKVRVSVERTVNLGNYENIKVAVEFVGSPNPDETNSEVTKRLYDEAWHELLTLINATLAKRKSPVQE